jgi:hypothetical protein
VWILVSSPQLTLLRTLVLADNGLGVAGVQALSGSPYLGNLTTLRLGYNDIGD